MNTPDEPIAQDIASRGLFLLTIREREILKAISTGLRNYEIADSLGISSRTVEKHIESILKKLGVKNRSQAAYLDGVHIASQPKSSTSGDSLRFPT